MEDQKNIAAGTAPDADDEIDLVELAGNFFRIAKRLWWLFVVFDLKPLADNAGHCKSSQNHGGVEDHDLQENAQ